MERRKVNVKTKLDVYTITLVGFGMALNVVGAFIALNLRLPIYMDSIGTILVACLLGPQYGILTGIGGSIVSGITFDIYSLYMAPVQISTGFMTGWLYQKGWLSGRKTLLGTFGVAIPTAMLSGIIAAVVFGGITSSGSSYVVQMLIAMGIPDVVSVFIIQIWTDYLDKYVAILLIGITIKRLPRK
ncbi:MAG: ECF transporter S component [Cellulosilyticaceae bacterium]